MASDYVLSLDDPAAREAAVAAAWQHPRTKPSERSRDA
jgi:hypothetical protein